MSRPVEVSIIIPNLHSPVVGQTLNSLAAQTWSGSVEIIVVGQDRHGLVTERPGLRHVVTSTPVSPACARNLGIRESSGNVLVFIDADCVAEPDWLAQLLAPYANAEVMVVGGSVDFPNDNYWTVCDNVATFHDYLPSNPAGAGVLLPTLNLSARRSVFSHVGEFDEIYPFAGEDAEFTTRLRLRGYSLQFEPRAKIVHLPAGRQDFRILVRRAYNIGRYSIKVNPRYRQSRGLSGLLQHWWSVLLLSPLLAAGVLMCVVFGNRSGLRYWKTFPVVYLLKCVWCLGAARTLWRGTAFA